MSYVPVNALLDYIGTATAERMKRRMIVFSYMRLRVANPQNLFKNYQLWHIASSINVYNLHKEQWRVAMLISPNPCSANTRLSPRDIMTRLQVFLYR